MGRMTPNSWLSQSGSTLTPDQPWSNCQDLRIKIF